MTGLTAKRFGLRDRGRLQENHAADLVIFDPAEVNNRATFADPLLPATGVSEVFVSGVAVVQEGTLTGARPGQVLRAH